MNSVTSIIYEPVAVAQSSTGHLHASPAPDLETAREIRQLEKIGKVLEKQFKAEIRRQFGQHIPKAFIETMVNQKVHHAFELIQAGTLQETLLEEHEHLSDFHQFLLEVPSDSENQIVFEKHGFRLEISRRKRGGWKAFISHATDEDRRVKTIKTRMSSSKSWDILRKKLLLEIIETRLEMQHVHGAKKHAKNLLEAFKHSAAPTAFSGFVRGLENFSHSNKMIPSKEINAAGGSFAAATVLTGLLEVNESRHHYHEAKKVQGYIDQHTTGDDEELKRMVKHLRRQALGSLTLGGVNTLEGAATLAYTTAVKTTAVVAATSALAVALGATSGGLAIAAGISSAAIHGHGLRKVRKRLSALKALSRNPDFETNNALLNDFITMQKRQLNNKKLNQYLNLSGDGMVVVGGVLMTAALVTGATTLGIGAGAVFGAALTGYTVAYGTKAYKNHSYKKEQKAMTARDIEHMENFDELKSDIGIMLRLAQAVKDEMGLDSKPFTDVIVRGYLGIEPALFVNMMDAVHDSISD